MAKTTSDLRKQVEGWTESDSYGGNYAPTWKPEPGQFVAGEIVQRHTHDGENGPAVILTLNDEVEGEVAIWCSNVKLKGFIEQESPEIGDVIGVKYLGKQKNPKTGRMFNDFAVKFLERKSKPPRERTAGVGDPRDPFEDD